MSSHKTFPPKPAVPATGSSENSRRCTELARRIQSGDESAVEELHQVLSQGIRFLLRRQLGPDHAEDRLNDVFLAVVEAIRNGKLSNPERLMGYVLSVIRSQIAATIKEIMQVRKQDAEMSPDAGDRGCNLERQREQSQAAKIMAETLRELSGRDREVLTRFYLLEQPKERICGEMDLTEAQFLVVKARAKAKFSEIGKKTVGRCGPTARSRRATGAS